MAYREEYEGFERDDEAAGHTNSGQNRPGGQEETPGKLNGRAKPKGPPPPDWGLFTYGDPIQCQRREYLIKGLVNRGDFSAWYGPPKGGKSFVLLELMLHVAAGRPWR